MKICGVTREADREAVVDAGADAVGVITDVPVDTPREVSPERAAGLVGGVPPLVTSVLVTMPDSVQAAVALQREVGADALQVHATLPPQKVGGLRARVDASVVAAVDADADLAGYAAAADALLVDSTDEDGAGGTGETHDWEATADLVEACTSPVILAGGLTPENVANAVAVAAPFGVDVASGVERTGGQKDHTALATFVRNAGRELEVAER